ncbi:DUF305 domain-containing protein [Mycobacterium lentiflavum]|uniref:DUF305 domain-containing protein n=1 Tax=Mycobacterium lentiflavum TaxID=141349 RepID=UPI001C300D5C|nr:DUF305 domain-containing protein [Mycobacterium lentiflavum]
MSSLAIRTAVALVASCTALLLPSCGGSSGDQAHSKRVDDTPVISGEPAAFSSADVMFANNGTAREEQGMSMARLVPDHSNNPDVAAFAAKTLAALQVDAQVLKALAAQWKEGQDNKTGTSAPSATAGESIDNSTIAKLQSMQGPEFDTLWLTSMIGLYQGIIDLANVEAGNGNNVDAISLAKQMVKERQADVVQIQQLLTG